MKRGCLFGLLAFGALIVLYDVALARYIDSPLHYWAAGFGALFGLMFVSSIIERWRGSRDVRLVRAAEAHQAPADGQMAAIVGPISPLGLPLRSPVTDTPCVLYEYEVNTKSSAGTGRNRQSSTTRHVSGIAMTPSAIATAQGGVRLLSFPLVDKFGSTHRSDQASRARVSQYLAATTVEPRGMLSALGAFAGALADDDGAVRVDYVLSGSKEIPPQASLSERVVPVGQMVCAIGRYSADKRGLIAKGATFIRLIPGDGATARKTIAAQSRTQFFAAAVFFIFSHAFIGGAAYMSATQYARATTQQQASALGDAIGRGDARAIELAVRRGADPNVMNSAGEVPVQLASDPETARALVRLGADVNGTGGSGKTPLMFAVMRRKPEMLQAWIAAGANVNFARPDGATALTDAEDDGQSDLIDILRAAGAQCDHVGEANGAALPADGGEPFAAVRDYTAAIRRRDLARLRALTQGWPPGFFEQVDWDVWQKTRPAAPRLASGFASASAATLSLETINGMGSLLVWSYQLVRTSSGWQIAREWVRSDGPAGDDMPAVEAPAAKPPAGGTDVPVERPRPSTVPDSLERPRAPARPDAVERPRGHV
jgi:ankyrin repeat protein